MAARVLITRPRAESERVAVRVAALGFTPVIAPVIEIVFLATTLPNTAFDALLLTSAHATTAVTDRDVEKVRKRPVFAVGSVSAGAARARGFADVRIAAGDGEALLSLIRMTHRGPVRLVYLAGRVRKPGLEDALVADGHDIRTLETYDARPVPWSDDGVEDLMRDPPGVCLHFSRRSAELALVASGERMSTMFDAMLHVCLSEDVAEPLRPGPRRRIAVADQANTESLLQSLVRSMLPGS